MYVGDDIGQTNSVPIGHLAMIEAIVSLGGLRETDPRWLRHNKFHDRHRGVTLETYKMRKIHNFAKPVIR